MKVRQFYEHLGGYLYVLSKADGENQKREEEVLMKEILEILNENPGFEKNAEVQGLLLTKLCYYNRERESVSINQTAAQFRTFISENGKHLSDKTKSIGLRLILKLAHAYKGVGTAERKLLADIEELLAVHRGGQTVQD